MRCSQTKPPGLILLKHFFVSYADNNSIYHIISFFTLWEWLYVDYVHVCCSRAQPQITCTRSAACRWDPGVAVHWQRFYCSIFVVSSTDAVLACCIWQLVHRTRCSALSLPGLPETLQLSRVSIPTTASVTATPNKIVSRQFLPPLEWVFTFEDRYGSQNSADQ